MRGFCLIVIFLISSFVLSAQVSNNFLKNSEEYFNYCIEKSDVIVEGKVASQNSYWNSTNTMIFTDNLLKIHHIFKGKLSIDSIVFKTKGGTVGNTKIEIDGLLSPKLNEKGVFYLALQNNIYEALEGKKEVDYLNNNIVNTPYKSFTLEEFKNNINKKLNKTPNNITSFPPPKGNVNNKSIASIDSLYPIIVPAGIGSVLTIKGQGFGVLRGDGKVLFTAVYPGEPINVEPYPVQYLSWSDTLIQVEVPSKSISGVGAGTGLIKVLSDSGIGNDITSSKVLQIPYSRYNLYNGNLIEPKFKDDNSSGGYNILLDSNIYENINANEAFQRSLETWRCATDVNWVIGTPISVATSAASDGNSVVRFSDLNPWNISITTKYFIQCGSDWYLREVDIDMNDSINWNFGDTPLQPNEWDFQSEMTLSLGLAHMLNRSNDSNSVMHHEYNLGEVYRTLATGDVDGGNYIMAQSFSSVGCGLGPMTPITTCNVGFNNDAASVEAILPLKNSCNGSLPVRVTIRNPGLDTLTSAQINWSVNGTTQPPFNWTGILAHGDTSLPIEIGFYNFSTGISAIEVNTSLPNGNPDQQVANDIIVDSVDIISCVAVDARISLPVDLVCLGYEPVIVDISNWSSSISMKIYNCVVQWEVDGVLQTPYYMNDTIERFGYERLTLGYYNFTSAGTHIKAWIEYPNGLLHNGPAGVDTSNHFFTPTGLAGTYTVGGVSPDYPDLVAAIQAIKVNGLCSSVVMNIRPGTYTGGRLFMTSTKSPSISNKLTFQSENGDSSSVIISGISTFGLDYTLSIEDIGYVSFNSVTFKNPTGSFDELVKLDNPKDNISFTNCSFIGNYGIFIYPQIALVVESNVNNTPSNLIVQNCHFSKVNSGISAFLYNDVIIQNNYFDSIAFNIISINQSNNVKITENYQTGNIYSNLYINNCDSSFNISKNEFYNTTIYLYVIDVQSSTPAIISNNIIRSSDGIGPLLFKFKVKNIDIIHNTLVSTNSPVIRMINGFPTNYGGVNFLNNNVLNTGTNVYGLFYELEFNTLIDFSDGNNYYALNAGPFADIDNVTMSTFGNYQTLTGLDSNSIQVNPQLNNPNNLHFIPQLSNLPLFRGGVTSNVSDDINGFLRNINPTIGADEVSFFDVDAEALTANVPTLNCDSSAVEFSFKNSGIDTNITSLTIGWSVNGVAQTPYSWTGNVPLFSSSSTFIIGGYNFLTNNNYNVKVWCENPNGSSDNNPINDTIVFDVNYIVNLSLGNDSITCAGDSIELLPNESFFSYLWSNTSTDSSINIGASGSYWCTVSNAHGCTTSDTINLLFKTLPIIDLGIDTGYCSGDSLLLDPVNSPGPGSYSWQDLSSDSIFTVTQPGIYWVEFSQNGCANNDSILIDSVSFPNVFLGNDSTLCKDEHFALNMTNPYSSFLWSDGSSNDTLSIIQAGQYWGTATNACGANSDTINLSFFTPTIVNLNSFNPNVLCSTDLPVVLPAGTPSGGVYSGNGVIGNSFYPANVSIGNHNVIYTIIDNNSCVNSDTTIITVDACTGIDNVNSDFGILIYPNPSTGLFIIEKPNDLNKDVQIRVLDATSKLIEEKVIPLGKQTIEVDITAYSNGVYYLQLQVDEEVVVKQILKK
ncbi:MAG: T9SS type A sorting domain-containing protein [Vicingaceae bacterium]